MISEEILAERWPILAREEGHRRGLPKWPPRRPQPVRCLSDDDYIALVADGATTADAVARRAGRSQSTVQHVLTRLVREGRLQQRRAGHGRGSEKRIYTVPGSAA